MTDDPAAQPDPTAGDFFTAGYAHRTVDELLAALRAHGVATLVDVRRDPVSRFRPKFNKKKLSETLALHGITYLHLPQLGVPKEIRTHLAAAPAGELARWYDATVIPLFLAETLPHLLRTARLPIVFLCAEKDPAACHRSRLAHALDRLGHPTPNI
jgi:uncharacterized protein (DUF488 family)